MRIVVTGGAGFVGSNLALKLQEKYQGHDIIVVDNFFSGDFKNLEGFRGEIITGDILQLNPSIFRGAIVFHNAAITDTTIHDPVQMMEANVEAFRKIITDSYNYGSSIIYASSSAVYGQYPKNHIDNNDSMVESYHEKPLNIYAFSKLSMDNITRKLDDNPAKKISLIGLRYFNVYGPREANKSGKTMSMIYQIYKTLKRGDKPKLFKMGDQKRDNVYVKDVVDANIAVCDAIIQDAKPRTGIYNLGSGQTTTFNKLVEIIARCLNLSDDDVRPDFIDNPIPDVYQNYTKADMSKLKRDFNWEPSYDIESGIADYIEYLEENDA